MARLRKASDIMINVQDTDQLSCSMLEHMYARNIIITGSWLLYDILYQKGAYLIKVDSLQEVGEKLLDSIKNFSLHQRLLSPNAKIADEIDRWDRNIKEWSKFFMGLM